MKYRIIFALVAALIPTFCFAADNLQVTQGSGTTVAADEVSRNSISEKQQVIKIGLGAEGQHDGLLDAGQQIMSSSVPVVVSSNQSSIPVAAAKIASDTAETSSTSTVINATAHVARVDDIIQFVGGTAGNVGAESVVTAVAANTITVAPAFPATPANGDTFLILRPTTPLMGNPNNSTGFGAGLITNPDWRYQDSTANGLLKREDDAHTSGDAGVACLGVANPSRATLAADGDYIPIATTVHGAAIVSLDATAVTSAGNQPVRTEDAAFAASDAVMMSGGVNNRSFAAYNSTNGDVTPFMVGDKGVAGSMLMYDSSLAGASSPVILSNDPVNATGAGVLLQGMRAEGAALSLANADGDALPISLSRYGGVYTIETTVFNAGTNLGKAGLADEDSAISASDALQKIGTQRQDNPTNDTSATGDAAFAKSNDLGAIYTDGVRRGTFTHSNPSIANGSSVTLLSSNTARRYLYIQNNSAANVCFNMNNASLTGIVPSNTNPCIVLVPGGSYTTPPNAAPTAAVTIYQTSGGAITSVSVVEGS